jgi:sulfopropanediol 3-dehydrogenase
MSRHLKQGAVQTAERSRQIQDTVSTILSEVEAEGEVAIRRWSQQLDGWNPERFSVDVETARNVDIDPQLKDDIDQARDNVAAFAEAQRGTLQDLEIETGPGIVLGHRHIPVGSVGSYSPGGAYPLIASSIMTVVTPRVAGVRSIVAAAPPRNPTTGMHPPQLYAMAACGADQIVCIGGVQAFAAMAFGIEDVEPVDMIVGPGNAYVAEAKRQLFGQVGIDLLAGPSEVCVIADETADARLVAADLLGQAEHGPTSPAVLITTSERLARSVIEEVDRWLEGEWPTKQVAGAAWRDFGSVIVCDDDDEMVRVSDAIGSEHLEVQTADPDWFHARLTNYGSLFLGEHSTVTFSDKSVGTNHVLPTRRASRYTGGLWVGKFLKTVTYQKLDAIGAKATAPVSAAIADAEMMLGHALTARLRLEMD